MQRSSKIRFRRGNIIVFCDGERVSGENGVKWGTPNVKRGIAEVRYVLCNILAVEGARYMQYRYMPTCLGEAEEAPKWKWK
jgi:hypothetical protein